MQDYFDTHAVSHNRLKLYNIYFLSCNKYPHCFVEFYIIIKTQNNYATQKNTRNYRAYCTHLSIMFYNLYDGCFLNHADEFMNSINYINRII